MAQAISPPDISTVPADLEVPAAIDAVPAPGVRSTQATGGWEETAVHHTLYLPRDWEPGRKYAVLIDYPGNGGYRNDFGDVSDGTVESCCLGYGISGGSGFIWICMPFVENAGGAKQNAKLWWGDLEETKRYCMATVRDVCARFGGDENALILCGFSRGSIAGNYIGLNDDNIAKLWRAFICHSHYDGVLRWPQYADSDSASALTRLKRLDSRPQFISHEGSTDDVEQWLRNSGIEGRWTIEPLPFRNHSAEWSLRDVPMRRNVREWLNGVLAADR